MVSPSSSAGTAATASDDTATTTATAAAAAASADGGGPLHRFFEPLVLPTTSASNSPGRYLFSLPILQHGDGNDHDDNDQDSNRTSDDGSDGPSSSPSSSSSRRRSSRRRVLNVLTALSFEPSTTILGGRRRKSRDDGNGNDYDSNSNNRDNDNNNNNDNDDGVGRSGGEYCCYDGDGDDDDDFHTCRNKSSSLSSSEGNLKPPSSLHGSRRFFRAQQQQQQQQQEDESSQRQQRQQRQQTKRPSPPPQKPPRSKSSTSRRRSSGRRSSDRKLPSPHNKPARVSHMVHGTLDPDGGVETVFYDAMQYGDMNETEFAVDFSRESVVLSGINSATNAKGGTMNWDEYDGGGGGGGRGGGRPSSPVFDESIEVSHRSPPASPFRPYPGDSAGTGGGGEGSRHSYSFLSSSRMYSQHSLENGNRGTPSSDAEQEGSAPDDASKDGARDRNPYAHLPYVPSGVPHPPEPPSELPLRFLRAGKGDPNEGLRRYEESLEWRRREGVDTILREASPHFELIKQEYPHFCFGKGKLGEPCFYEQPPKTNLKALRAGGVTLDLLLRHYVQVSEFQWQFLERDDLQRSVYIIDLNGIRFGDFVGEVVDFVKLASALSAQHYPERAGYVFVINVPAWFKIIWSVVKPMVDESTLEKIYILRGADEIRENMQQRIDLDQIPAEYGGNGPPLAESKEERTLAELIDHNNALAAGDKSCGGPKGGKCKFCAWVQPRSY